MRPIFLDIFLQPSSHQLPNCVSFHVFFLFPFPFFYLFFAFVLPTSFLVTMFLASQAIQQQARPWRAAWGSASDDVARSDGERSKKGRRRARHMWEAFFCWRAEQTTRSFLFRRVRWIRRLTSVRNTPSPSEPNTLSSGSSHEQLAIDRLDAQLEVNDCSRVLRNPTTGEVPVEQTVHLLSIMLQLPLRRQLCVCGHATQRS